MGKIISCRCKVFTCNIRVLFTNVFQNIDLVCCTVTVVLDILEPCPKCDFYTIWVAQSTHGPIVLWATHTTAEISIWQSHQPWWFVDGKERQIVCHFSMLLATRFSAFSIEEKTSLQSRFLLSLRGVFSGVLAFVAVAFFPMGCLPFNRVCFASACDGGGCILPRHTTNHKSSKIHSSNKQADIVQTNFCSEPNQPTEQQQQITIPVDTKNAQNHNWHNHHQSMAHTPSSSSLLATKQKKHNTMLNIHTTLNCWNQARTTTTRHQKCHAERNSTTGGCSSSTMQVMRN